MRSQRRFIDGLCEIEIGGSGIDGVATHDQQRLHFAGIQVLDELAGEGLPAAMPRLGMMVEVPAAALNIAAFALDFYSIGSNDLVQYVTATSRDCAAVAALHDPRDPAVLELIGRVVAHGAATGREVGLCGDMASDPRYLPALLDLGLASLSVAPSRLAKVKAQIARHD